MIRSLSTLGLLGMATVVCLALPRSGEAVLYQCTNSSGSTVYSDSPAQLKHCRPYQPSPFGAPGGLQSGPGAGGGRPPFLPQGMPEPAVPTTPSDPAPPGDAVPLQRVGNLFIVEATLLDTRRARLIVDTGASHTILSPAIARELGLPGQSGGQGVTVKTAGGPVQAEVVTLPLVQVGEAVAHNVLAGVFDIADVPPEVDGLLGLTFLSRFLVTIDAEKGELHLRPRQ